MSDAAAIAAVHRAAFPSDEEARLVAAVVDDGDALVSMVADDKAEIVGHVMFSRMTVLADGAPIVAAGLAPVAVRPQRQGQGIGSRLVHSGLGELAAKGVVIVFVLGDPRFYRRFGFETAHAAPFDSVYAGPHLMASWLGKPLAVAKGSADYAPAFSRLGTAG